jgi:hypothetical protein
VLILFEEIRMLFEQWSRKEPYPLLQLLLQAYVRVRGSQLQVTGDIRLESFSHKKMFATVLRLEWLGEDKGAEEFLKAV